MKYFKQENSESSPKASDSQEMIKNLLNTFFPKNKQINKKSYFHSLTKLNGIWLHNKPPKNHSIYSKKYNSLHELIPISINIIYEEIYFQEVILWDNQKTEIHEILTFSFLYLQDLMKEKEKFNIEKKNLESNFFLLLLF